MADRDLQRRLIRAVRHGDIEAAVDALDAGAAADSRSVLGEPALNLAAAGGNCDLIALLLDRGADIGKTSDQANSALMEASARGHYDAAVLLLDRGADPAAPNKWGQTARDWSRWAPAEADMVGLIDSRLES